MAWLEVTLLDANEDGLTRDEEAEKLYVLDDALKAELACDASAVFVGRQTTNGKRGDFVFCEEPLALESRLGRVLAGFPSYSHRQGSPADQGWTTNLDYL